jgi:hypothetical protein
MYSCYGGMLLSWWSLECLNVGDVTIYSKKKPGGVLGMRLWKVWVSLLQIVFDYCCRYILKSYGENLLGFHVITFKLGANNIEGCWDGFAFITQL